MNKRITAAAAAFGFFCFAGTAAASVSGTVTGKLQYFENQGNFCPTGRDCTGAIYTQSTFNTNLPIRNVKVYAINSGGTVIGQGSADYAGNYTIAWTDPGYGSAYAHIEWHGEQKDGHFTVSGPNGETRVWWTYNGTWSGGTTTNLGALTWGSSGAPNDVANVFAGATREWDRLGTSNRMNGLYTGLQIRAFEDSTGKAPDGTKCPTSCAYGSLNRIYLDANSMYEPQGRVMHEMGHIASYKSHTWHSAGDYCYGGETAPCGWSLNSAENDDVGFEEGFATFVGDSGLYNQNAVAPHTCLSTSSCSTGYFNIETSSGNGTCGSCATNEDRMPITSDRMMWDTFDNATESYSDPFWFIGFGGRPGGHFCLSTPETSTHYIWEFFDTMNAWPSGTASGQSEEMWCDTSYSKICDSDGRSALDFQPIWKQWVGDGLVDQRADNCNVGH